MVEDEKRQGVKAPTLVIVVFFIVPSDIQINVIANLPY